MRNDWYYMPDWLDRLTRLVVDYALPPGDLCKARLGLPTRIAGRRWVLTAWSGVMRATLRLGVWGECPPWRHKRLLARPQFAAMALARRGLMRALLSRLLRSRNERISNEINDL